MCLPSSPPAIAARCILWARRALDECISELSLWLDLVLLLIEVPHFETIAPSPFTAPDPVSSRVVNSQTVHGFFTRQIQSLFG